MFTTIVHDEPDGRTKRLEFTRDAAPLTFEDVLTLWRGDPAWRAHVDDALGSLPFDAFRWECPPCTRDTLGRTFECAVIDAPYLDRAPEQAAFAEHRP